MKVNSQKENNESNNEENVDQSEVFDSSNELTEILIFLEEQGISQDSVITWKNTYGNIYISQIHENGRVFLWKKLNRGEYRQIIESGAMAKEMSYQDAVLRKCLLFPKPDQGFLVSSDAGVVPTLFSQVMYQSGFIQDHIAFSLITEI